MEVYMSVVNGDLLDEGLQSVMGKDRCQNDWKPSKKPMADASWEPVKEPHWMDNMKSCAKSVLLFGGLSFLVFYWQQAGLMAESIAVPCIAVCTALAGWGCGKHACKHK
jgi:hypothetical protein